MIRFVGLWRLEVLRLLRGWRWRVFALGCLGAAYWFGRSASFGPGSLVWFPGGPRGVSLFTVFFAVSAVILSVESIGTWPRHGAARLLDARLLCPGSFVFSRLLAVLATMVLPLALVVYWPVIGAWRADYMVLWNPNGLYLLIAGLPAAMVGAAAGLFARSVIRKDIPAIFAGVILSIPFLWFRLRLTPAIEVFNLASLSLGILVPGQTMAREVLICIGYALLLASPVALFLHTPESRKPVGRLRFWRLGIPRVMATVHRAGLLVRQWTALTLAGSVLCAAAGLWLVQPGWRIMRGGSEPLDWGRVVAPPNTAHGRIASAIVRGRSISLPDQPGKPVTVSLELEPPPWDRSNYAILTFGDSLMPVSIEGGEMVKNVFPTGLPYYVVRLPDAYASGKATTVSLQLLPTERGLRLWERAYHPAFHRFSFLGPWYGDTAAADFYFQEMGITAQAAPFRIDVPDTDELDWACGSARLTGAGGNHVIEEQRPARPDRLIAAPLVSVAPEAGELPNMEMLVLPHRRNLARNMYILYQEPLIRLRRTFGEPAEPLVLFEVPERNPTDPLALPSSLLDNFEMLVASTDNFFWGGIARAQLENSFAPIHQGLVREYVLGNFSRIEDPELLSEGLINYMHGYALGTGVYANIRQSTRRDIVLIPWEYILNRRRFTPGGGVFPFDIKDSRENEWRGAASMAQRDPTLPEPPPQRYQAFFHMLRGVLGDDDFRLGVYTLMQEHRGETLDVGALQDAMEKASGESLEEFFHQWLVEGVMPRYRIREGQAYLLVNPNTRDIEYRTEVRIANDGDGRMPVPWMLATEGEPITGTQWLGAGETVNLSIATTDRPVFFEIDPNGWIAQIPPEDDDAGTHARVYFKTVTEM